MEQASTPVYNPAKKLELNPKGKGKFKLLDEKGEVQHATNEKTDKEAQETEIVRAYKDYSLAGWTITPEDPRVTHDPEVIKRRAAQSRKRGRELV